MKQLRSIWVYPFAIVLYGWLQNVFALFMCGASLGWLMGMSMSPVLQTVLAALLAIVATLLTATLGLPKSSDVQTVSLTDTLSGLSNNLLSRQTASEKRVAEPADKQPTELTSAAPAPPVRQYNALPLGWFLLCLAGGAAGGIFTRTNELLGTIPGVVTGRLGVSRIDSALIAKQLLAEQYGLNHTTPALPSASRFSAAALFSSTKDSVDFCTAVKFMNGPELQDELDQQIRKQLNRSPSGSERRNLEQLQRVLTRQPDERVLQQIRDRLCTHP